jgi:hypothetical protein
MRIGLYTKKFPVEGGQVRVGLWHTMTTELSAERLNSLGTLSVLTDELLIVILGDLNRHELLAASLVSRAFFRLCNLDEIWREVCFDKWIGDFQFKINWKITTFFPKKDPPEALKKRPNVKVWRSSSLDQKQFRCLNSPETYVSKKHSPEVDILTPPIDWSSFRKKYDKSYPEWGRPVLLKGVLASWKWPAIENWTPEKLCQRFKDKIYKIGEYNRRGQRVKMTFGNFFRYMKEQKDEEPMYLFDNAFGERVPEMLKDYSVPQYFQEDFFVYFEKHRPQWRWFLVGPMRSGTSFHIDPNGTSAWNALVYGRKRWTLYPPDVSPPGIDVHKIDKSGYIHDPRDIPSAIRWHHVIYPQLEDSKKPIEFTQEAGDVVFVPAGWWHQVLNLTDTVAVTQNVCNSQNFLRTIETMFDEHDNSALELFIKMLKPKRPDLYNKAVTKQKLIKKQKKEEKKRKKRSVKSGPDPTPLTMKGKTVMEIN